MVEFFLGFVFGCVATVFVWSMYYVALRENRLLSSKPKPSDKVDVLAVSIGKKIESVPAHYEVKDAPQK